MKTPAILLTLTTCLLSFSLLSMPSPDELEKVKPLVQDLMKSDLDAMKLGKKSRADVAKSAMSLYPQAESQAAKLLLARSAFNLYVKAGEYEAAEKALDALLSAVPDYPALEQAELLEKALFSVPYKSAPNLRARLAAIKEKAQAAGQLKSLLSGFDALAEGPKRKAAATRIAISYVSLGDWPNAVKYFALSDSPAASAAQAELHLADEPEASRSYDKAANAWWSVELPKRDSKLALSFRAHAADLYTKALPTLTGLAKVQADRRIKEYTDELAAASTPAPQSSSVASKRNPYVTKGLVAMWDGEWNAGFGQHDGNARVWKDLIGKSDGKPFGATRFSDKSVLLDGNSFWEITPSSELFNVLLDPSVTCEVVLRFGKGAIVKNEGIIGFGKSSSRVLWGYAWGGPMGPDASIVFQHKGSPISQYWRAKGSFDGLHTIAISASNGDVFGWIDAKVCVKTKSTGANNPTPCYIGYIDGWAKMIGEIYCVRIYDHALDARELLSNHAVDKKRFRDGK